MLAVLGEGTQLTIITAQSYGLVQLHLGLVVSSKVAIRFMVRVRASYRVMEPRCNGTTATTTATRATASTED